LDSAAEIKNVFEPFESFQRQLCATQIFEHFALDVKIPQPENIGLKHVISQIQCQRIV
jgi:hypothetical protein